MKFEKIGVHRNYINAYLNHKKIKQTETIVQSHHPQGGVPMPTDIEQRTIARVLWRFIPFLGLCFAINWLDRTNVAFAALTMNKELAFSATVFGTGAGIFFVGFMLCEVPSNLALARLGGRVWITRIMLTWGLLAMAMACVSGEYSFCITRFLLGAAEGGFYPGVIYFFSQWIPYRHRGRAFGIFGACGVSAITISGPLAAWILQFDGLLGLSGWRWLFLVEGVPACVAGIICFFYLTDRPKDAHWLSDAERAWLIQTLAAERETFGASHHVSVWQGLSDIRVLTLCLVYFSFGLAIFGVGNWLPLIMKDFGVSNMTVGYLSAVPGICGILGILFWPQHSDRKNDRRWHLVTMGIGAGGGLLLAAWQLEHPYLVMLGLCITAFFAYGNFAIILTWPTATMSGPTAAGATALITAIGTSSGYIGSQLIGVLRDLTGGYQSAMAWTACGVFIAPIVLMLFGRFVNITANRATDSGVLLEKAVTTP